MTIKKKVRDAYMFVNMEKAFLYSIINDLNLSQDLRQKVVKAEFKRLKNVQAGSRKPAKSGNNFFGNMLKTHGSQSSIS